jgi:serine/threonine-protein kinase RsbW
MREIATLKVEAALENVPLAIECVARAAREAGVDEKTLYQVQLAVDEACANVALHAYKGLELGDMQVTCYLDAETLSISVRDWGKGFVPEDVPRPKIDAPLEERTLGGLGLFMIQQVMDHVRYTFDAEAGNELFMQKRLPLAA